MTRMIHSTAVLLGACALALSSPALADQRTPAMDRKDAMAGSAMMDPLTPFSKTAFDAARAAGKTTLVFFHAPWCSVCRAQEPKVVARLTGSAKHVVAFKVDYDSSKDLRTDMQVAKQSTLILFNGTKEIARLSYKSDDASMDEFFSHAAMAVPMAGAR